MLSSRLLINGEWRNGAADEWLDVWDPASGERLGRVAVATEGDTEAAISAAKQAYPAWRATPAPRRAEILFRVAESLRDRKEELAQLMTREMGKVLAEARGDVQEGIDMTYFMAGEGRRQAGHTVPAEHPNKFAMSIREPIGVVACITPWNFPLAIPSWKMMPALVTGNTVVLKPASDTPLLAARLVELLVDAGIPPGVINLVNGAGSSVGKTLVTHPDVAVVSFTGSLEVGRSVSADAAPLLKRVHLELGGKNAIVVLDDADLDLAADGIIWSAYGTTGQRCTACSRVVVQESVADALIQRLLTQVNNLRLGHGLDEAVNVGPVINQRAVDKIHAYVGIGQQEGAQLMAGGSPATHEDLADGCFYQPTLFDGVTPEMRIAQEEIFGPVLSILRVPTEETALQVANGTPFGLSASIYTGNVNRAFRFMRGSDTGLLYINAGTIGSEVQLPFGGMKATGNGHREAGLAALDVFTEWKSVYIDYSGTLQRAQIDVDE